MLINPAGVAIGSGARLDISGSLLVSSADEVFFADGTRVEMASSDPIQLTAAAPSEFGFLGSPGAIRVAADQLVVDATDPGPAVAVLTKDAQPEQRWEHTRRAWLTSILALLALTILPLVATAYVLRRYDPGR